MRIAKVDANQPKIVDRVRELGGEVMHTHMVGRGAPDIIVGCDGLTIVGLTETQRAEIIARFFHERRVRVYSGCAIPVEIKDGSKSPSEIGLTPDEIEFHDRWRKAGGLIQIWYHEQDVDGVLNHDR